MNIKGTLDVSLDKKHKILQVAKARFLHYGVSKTTTRDIAEDLGISVSNLYLYFENKRELILAIAEECRAEQDKTDQEILSDTSLVPSLKLERLLVKKFRQVQDFRTESPKGTELIAYLVQEYPERLLSWQNNLEKLILSVLEEGVAAGDFLIQDVRHSAHMLRIALSQFFLPAHIQLPIEPSEEELVAFVHWHLSLISPSSP